MHQPLIDTAYFLSLQRLRDKGEIRGILFSMQGQRSSKIMSVLSKRRIENCLWNLLTWIMKRAVLMKDH